MGLHPFLLLLASVMELRHPKEVISASFFTLPWLRHIHCCENRGSTAYLVVNFSGESDPGESFLAIDQTWDFLFSCFKQEAFKGKIQICL